MFVLIGIVWNAMLLASSFPSAFTLLLLFALFLGIYHPSIYPYLSGICTQNKGRMFGLFETGGGLGRLIAPSVAGFMGVYFGWRYVYALWGLVAAATAFLLYMSLLRNRPGRKTEDEIHEENDTRKDSIRRSVLHPFPTPRLAYFASVFFGFVLFGTTSFLPLFLTDVHSVSMGLAGAALTVFFVGATIGNMIGGRLSDGWSPGRVLELGFVGSSLFLFLLPFASGPFVVFVLLCAGIAVGMILPAINVCVDRGRTTNLGLAYGLQSMSSSLGTSSGLACGLISDMVGIQSVFFLLSGGTLFAAVVIFLVLTNKGRKQSFR